MKSKVTTNQFSVKVLVARGDAVLIRGDYGQSGRKHGAINNNLRFRFPVGTIAEQFVAVAVLQLEEQGKVKINASICSYVSNCPGDWKDIQVVHLLTHTSGLPSLKQSPPNQKNSAPPHTMQELLAAVGGQSLGFKPGSEFKYNKLDFIMLCLAIESVSGRLPKEYIETEVFHALKMTDTEYPTSENVPTSPHASHIQDDKSWKTSKSPIYQDNARSTVADLYRWNRALIRGTIISHDSLVQMFTPYRDGHGLGWKIIKEFDRRLALQSGQSDGVSVSVRLYPDDDTCIILVGEGSNVDSVELTHDIGAILFGSGYPASRRVLSSARAWHN